MFLTHAELTTRTDLTWSTPPVAQEFVENQEVVLSVVTRRANTKRSSWLSGTTATAGISSPHSG